MRLFAATFGKVPSNRLYPIPEIFCNEKVTRDCRAGHAVSIGPGPLNIYGKTRASYKRAVSESRKFLDS
jgi:hypothetical protein